MKFLVKSVCKVCGHIFDNYKRYNAFIDEWELEADTCDNCARNIAFIDQSNIPIDYPIQ